MKIPFHRPDLPQDLNQVEDRIKKDPLIKAFFPVHYGRSPVNMKQLIEICQKS
jgi:dTDP-4-amino-4,6-dideoxygalactose transaminase